MALYTDPAFAGVEASFNMHLGTYGHASFAAETLELVSGTWWEAPQCLFWSDSRQREVQVPAPSLLH